MLGRWRSCATPRSAPTRPAATRPASSWTPPAPATPRCRPWRPRWATRRRRSCCRRPTAASGSATSARWPRCRSAATRPSRPPWRTPSGTAPGRLRLQTRAGLVGVDDPRAAAAAEATLVSVRAAVAELAGADLAELLDALRWDGRPGPGVPGAGGLRRRVPPDPGGVDPGAAGRAGLRLRRAAGADGPRDWTTVDLVWRESSGSSTPATRSRPAGSSRTRPPARPRRRSAAICATSGLVRRRRRSRSTRATTWAGPVCSPSASPGHRRDIRWRHRGRHWVGSGPC